MGQKSTQTTERTIRGAGGNEAAMNALFTQIAQQAGGNLGDLQNLLGGPNAQDQALVDQSIGASSDMARRQLEKTLTQIMAQQSDALAARGIQGSSIEAMMAGQVGSEGLRQFADQLSQQQQQGAQALMNLPFQRAQVELGRNQALLQRLTSLGGAVQQGGLQERLNTISTKSTQETPMSAGQMMQIGQTVGALAAAPFTGGASLAGLGIPGFGQQQAPQGTPNGYDASTGIPYRYHS